MSKKIMVYGQTFDRAKRMLDDLIKDIDEDDIMPRKNSSIQYCIMLKDGTFYEAVKASDYCRGYRAN